MNIDIDDILAELDRDTTAVERESSSYDDVGNKTVGGNGVSQLGDVEKQYSVQSSKSERISDFQKLVTQWRKRFINPNIVNFFQHL